MREDYEAKHHRLEKENWFLASRRSLIRRFLSQEPRQDKIIEIGCSSGVLLQELREDGFIDITGVDVSEIAIKECQRAGLAKTLLIEGATLPFPDGLFSVAIASDVLEHIERDAEALREWCRVIKPGGELLLLVPAFQFLWSGHDVVNKHFRRYEKRGLLDLVAAAGFALDRVTYWNTLLFIPISIIRLLLRIKPARDDQPAKDQLFELSRGPNTALRAMLGLENSLLSYGFNFPFGVSLVVRARKL